MEHIADTDGMIPAPSVVLWILLFLLIGAEYLFLLLIPDVHVPLIRTVTARRRGPILQRLLILRVWHVWNLFFYYGKLEKREKRGTYSNVFYSLSEI